MTKKPDTVFKVRLEEDKPESEQIEYQVKEPGANEHKQALMEYNRAFGEAIKSGAVLRAKLHEYMQEQKIWSDDKAKKFTDVLTSINEQEKKIALGGMKLKEAVSLAKELRANRAKLQSFLSERGSADSSTAEGQAENARFQRLLVACLVYKKDNKSVFSNVEDLLNETDWHKVEVSTKAFDILGQLYYKIDDKYELNLPENKFLRQWNLMNDTLQYLNEKGEPVNEEGKRVNKDGHLINDNNELIDYKGNVIDSKGEFVSNSAPFLDDDGNPLSPPRVLEN